MRAENGARSRLERSSDMIESVKGQGVAVQAASVFSAGQKKKNSQLLRLGAHKSVELQLRIKGQKLRDLVDLELRSPVGVPHPHEPPMEEILF
jgi:hypothetical protein